VLIGRILAVNRTQNDIKFVAASGFSQIKVFLKRCHGLGLVAEKCGMGSSAAKCRKVYIFCPVLVLISLWPQRR